MLRWRPEQKVLIMLETDENAFTKQMSVSSEPAAFVLKMFCFVAVLESTFTDVYQLAWMTFSVCHTCMFFPVYPCVSVSVTDGWHWHEMLYLFAWISRNFQNRSKYPYFINRISKY